MGALILDSFLTQDSFIKLREILDNKKELLYGILILTEKISKGIEDEDVEKINSYIGEKQELIDQINILDKEYRTCFGNIKPVQVIEGFNKLQQVSNQEIQNLCQSIKQITELLKKIESIEKINSINAQSLLNKFSEEIKTINKAKKASLAYNAPVQAASPSYFFDQKR
ncbi:MAG TPA: flagellar protein FlgN [Clostridiaceae bacterium]|nr:flagellar protein FlgN [Clostridiaceae bacterium]